MPIPEIIYCPSLLSEGYHSYSPAALKRLFDGNKVSHLLPYDAPWKNDDESDSFIANRKRISISGVQEKYSLTQKKNKLLLTEDGEQGTHILKAHPVDLKRPEQLPANEHLTMQIAAQVYNLNTAASGLIFFRNGDPAYITRRFDLMKGGGRLGKEDFASLGGKTEMNSGPDFKYDGSYEKAGALIQYFVGAEMIEMEKFFSLVLFNYLFSNGDAHLKNFALLETPGGDYTLSPAYDLVNTRLHIGDDDFALKKGLFEDGFKSKAFLQFGHAGKEDFIELAGRLHMNPVRVNRIMERFLREQPMVSTFTNRSFLKENTKKYYLLDYKQRLKALNS